MQKSPSDANNQKKRTLNWREFACGWGAAFFNISITYPLNKLIFRQMLHGVKASGAVRELRSEGIFYLYRGILPPLCHKSVQMSLMFGIHEAAKSRLVNGGFSFYTSQISAAAITGSFQAMLTPFERVQALLSDSSYHKQFKNTYDSFWKLGRIHGYKEYYRGFTPCLMRNITVNVIFFFLKEESRKRKSAMDKKWADSKLMEFATGSLIGALMSLTVYPLNVVKISMQTRIGGEYEGFFKVLRDVYRERGSKTRYLYYGANLNVLRAFLAWGIMNFAYESLKDILYRF